MRTIKAICPHCGMPIEFTRWEKIWNLIYGSIGPTLMALGLLFLFYGYMVGPNQIIEGLVEFKYKLENIHQDDELRLIALEITKNCSTDRSECFIKSVFNNVSNIRYVPTSIYNAEYEPIYVYKHGGDCKNTAEMVTALLGSVGIEGNVRCSIDESHCVSEFYETRSGRHMGGKFVIDLTISTMVYMNETGNMTTSEPLGLAIWFIIILGILILLVIITFVGIILALFY